MKRLFALVLVALASISQGLAQDAPRVGIVPSDEGLFPFVISYDMARGATDFSQLLDAPAGKHGFTRIEGNHFVNDAGRIRFNGVNVVGGACFPVSHEQAERMAKRLAHFGINLVRLHFFDLVDYRFRLIHEKGLLVDDGTWCTIDPEQQEKFDYLLYQFKKHGIYLDVNLMVGRPFKPRNGFDEEIQQKEIELTQKLFTHVNPYTGLSWIDDPAVALVETNNENAIVRTWESKESWDPSNGEPAWLSRKELYKESPEKKLEMLEALEAADRNHWNRQREMLRELGLKVPVTSTQVDYTTPWAVMDMDYFDIHSYWCHPSKSGNKDEWTINNIPMVNDLKGGRLAGIASYRPADRPFTVSEYNHPFPIVYGAEGQPMLRAYAAFQGWDGVIAHSYNNQPDEEPDFLAYNFTYAARTDAMAHFIACATMFLRTDVKESNNEYVLNMPRKDYEADWIRRLNNRVSDKLIWASDTTFLLEHRMMHRFATDYKATEHKAFQLEEIGPVQMSDGGEIEWNHEIPDQSMFIVRTDNTKVFSGFPAGRTIDWGDGISFTVGETKLGWTTMSLVSRKANGFAGKGTALLVATGYTKQTDQKFTVEPDPKNPSKPSTIIHSRNEDWGHGPMLTEGIPATVKLASKARKTRCWALNERGKRMKRVKVQKAEDGCALIEISPKYKTVWYEIKTR